MKELVSKDEFISLLDICTEEEFVEYCRNTGLPTEPMKEVAKLSDETLNAIESANALDAAYAAFKVGYAMAFAEGQGKAPVRMMQGKIDDGLIYSEEFKQRAVALARELLNESPKPDLKVVAIKVKRELGGRPCYKTLMEWLKEAQG